MTRATTRIDRASFADPGVTGPVLYRCYGLDGTLMYIGQTDQLRKRIRKHRAKPWWFAVEYITVQRYRSWKVLGQDELRAIRWEKPHFNQIGRTGATYGATLAADRKMRSVFGGDANAFGVVQK